MKVATAAQTRRLEQQAVDQGSSWEQLMADAGQGMAYIAVGMLPEVGRATVVVLVGPGNNGGDGLVIARHLHEAGANVTVFLWNRKASPKDWPRQATLEAGIPEVQADGTLGMEHLHQFVARADLIVDALLGTGLTRPLSDELCAIVEVVNQSKVPVLAVDLPTGINTDTGAVMGCAIQATTTAAAGVLKPGHLLAPGSTYAASVQIVPIGLPEDLEDETMAEMMTNSELRTLLPARPADSNKGTFGKVLAVGGSARYPGAVYLTARSALRTGAGLVTIAAGRSIIGALAAASHETTFLPLPEEDWGVLGGSAASELLSELSKYSSIVLGPGLGQEDATKTFVKRLLKIETEQTARGVGFVRGTDHHERQRKPSGGVGFVRTTSQPEEAKPAEPATPETTLPPLVLDADALNILAGVEEWTSHLEPGTAILTPHPGEMARLLGLEGAAEVNADRLGTARRAAAQWQQIVVLKGASTIVADPDGQVAIGPAGNPALATAGTGDVLAGAIGSLLAQGVQPFDAARLGVFLHAAAGRFVREEVGDAGAVAGDLLERLPRAITALRTGRS